MVALQNLQKEGGKMKKGKQVSIRLTEEEYDFIQSCLGQGESSVTKALESKSLSRQSR